MGQLDIQDVQDLIVFAALGSGKKLKPKWITLHKKYIKKVVFVLVSAVGKNDFNGNKECFTNINGLFPMVSTNIFKAYNKTFVFLVS